MFAHDTTRFAPVSDTRAACGVTCSSGPLTGEAGVTSEGFPLRYRPQRKGANSYVLGHAMDDVWQDRTAPDQRCRFKARQIRKTGHRPSNRLSTRYNSRLETSVSHRKQSARAASTRYKTLHSRVVITNLCDALPRRSRERKFQAFPCSIFPFHFSNPLPSAKMRPIAHTMKGSK
jgi:hypothetical protein